MNKVEMIQFLLAQLKQPGQDHNGLVEVFENYRAMLLTLDASASSYHNSLRRLREEFPDIERLITKRHEPILKGRLMDALTAFRKIVEDAEAETKDDDMPADTNAAEPEKRVRNMPNLGMS